MILPSAKIEQFVANKSDCRKSLRYVWVVKLEQDIDEFFREGDLCWFASNGWSGYLAKVHPKDEDVDTPIAIPPAVISASRKNAEENNNSLFYSSDPTPRVYNLSGQSWLLPEDEDLLPPPFERLFQAPECDETKSIRLGLSSGIATKFFKAMTVDKSSEGDLTLTVNQDSKGNVRSAIRVKSKLDDDSIALLMPARL
tara:strand:- start:1021 stop:1614 length:594 start_codon:yes stop_codon:yes gene_type:complete